MKKYNKIIAIQGDDITTINPKNILQKKPVLVKILRTFKDSYDFEYSYLVETTKQKGNATILE